MVTILLHPVKHPDSKGILISGVSLD